MIKQVLKFLTLQNKLPLYGLYDSNNQLLATVLQKTKDANIHEIFFYGGDKHGKTMLTEGNIDGLMEKVGELF